MLLRTTEVAEFFDVSDRTVRTWGHQGCPEVKHDQWDLKQVFQWWLDNIHGAGDGTLDSRQERAKLLQKQREKAALQVAQMERRLVPVDKVTELWQRITYEVFRAF